MTRSVAFAPGTRWFNIFFCCHFARAVWSITNAASGLLQPHSISHMFGNWLQGISKEMKPLVLLGAATTCWSFWLCRNDLVFERKINPSSLHVIFSVIHWLRSWIILQNSGFFFTRTHGRRSTYWLTVISISVHHFFVVSILGCVHPRNAEAGNVQVFCINKVFVMKKKKKIHTLVCWLQQNQFLHIFCLKMMRIIIIR